MTAPIYNNHSLFLYTGVAEKEQITECFLETIKALNIPCRFKVNPVWSSKEQSVGYTFVWVSSPAVYYAFTGRNLDGSERIEYVPDENWSPPGTPLEQAIERLENESTSPGCQLSWADMGEVEEKKIELEALYVRPMIKKQLPPLITNLKYKYTKEQKDYWMKNSENTQTDKGNKSSVVPDFGSFVIHPSHIHDLEDSYCPYILTAKKIPDFVNEKNLKEIMQNYASDPFRKIVRNTKSGTVLDTYPFVVIVEREYKTPNSYTKSRTAFVTFDSYTNDARFALQMVKKLEVTDPRNHKIKEMMYFDHSYNFK